MVIDFHHHLFNREWIPEAFWSGLVQRAVNVRRLNGQEADPQEIARGMFDLFADPHGDALAADMAEAGIAYTLIMPLDLGLELGECPVSIEEKNRLIAGITRHHAGRIGAFCGVDPRRQDGVALFEKAVRQWGMLGLKLDPAAGFYPNDRLVYPTMKRPASWGCRCCCTPGRPSRPSATSTPTPSTWTT